MCICAKASSVRLSGTESANSWELQFSIIYFNAPFLPIRPQMAAIDARFKKSMLLRCTVTSTDSRAPLCYFSVKNKLDGIFLFLGVHSSDKEKIIFPLLQMRKQKVKQINQGHKHEWMSFLESQWSLTQTGDCSLCLGAVLCNYSTAVFALHCNRVTKVQKSNFDSEHCLSTWSFLVLGLLMSC